MKSYKSLDQLVLQLIRQNTSGKINNASMSSNYSSDLLPYSSNKDVSSDETSEIVRELVDSLIHLIKPSIDSGLEVTATNPSSMFVNVSSGSGSAAGRFLEMPESITVQVPNNSLSNVFYVNYDGAQTTVDTNTFDNKLTLAKIVIPDPKHTLMIEDNQPIDTTNINGWIVSGKDVLFDGKWTFDDDSIAVLGNKLGYILAKNIFGELNLSENLTIKNTQGTLFADSKSLQLFYEDTSKAAEFNRGGVYFYNTDGYETARFTSSDARVGNIVIEPSSLHSGNYITGLSGFKINDDGTAEFSDVTVRGTIYASLGTIGGWSIDANKIYNTGTGSSGIIQGGTYRTSATAGAGSDGVILDSAGLRGYSSTLGQVFNLPTDGSAPTFSSGVINSTIFNINTSAVLRTSDTVGDGSADSAGILINNTGVYGCGANQILNNANFKILNDGSAFFSGEIVATSGTIGGITITSNSLSGGTIIGSTILGGVYENSDSLPRIRIDENGAYYQITETAGKYGELLYGTGTGSGTYGTGVLAYLFNTNYPVLSIEAETPYADLRLYNRTSIPTGAAMIGDIIMLNGVVETCSVAGTPGTYTSIGGSSDSITINNAPTNLNISGIEISFVAANNQVFGDVCYINSSGQASIGDAKNITSGSAIAMAAATISASASGNYLLHGIARNNSWNWSIGGLMFLATSGASTFTLTQTAPTGVNQVIQVLGVATDTNKIYFNPSLSQVEHV